MAHYEPPHQDLRCLQIQLFLSLVVKELREARLQIRWSFKDNSVMIFFFLKLKETYAVLFQLPFFRGDKIEKTVPVFHIFL